MKILNLYAGIGGNRKLWGSEHNITAVENNESIANIYRDFYPHDKVVIGDAHDYLLNHFTEFDFIWSSPPCQSHSQIRQNLGVRFRGFPVLYPDMSLYQEIILLMYNFDGLWVIENTVPYYKSLIPPTFTLQRHLFWSNFNVASKDFPNSGIRKGSISSLQETLKINISKYKIKNKRQVLRNCIYPPLGKRILDTALSLP